MRCIMLCMRASRNNDGLPVNLPALFVRTLMVLLNNMLQLTAYMLSLVLHIYW